MLKMNALAEPRREDAPGIWAWCSSLHSASQHTSSGNTGGRRTVVALLRGGHQGTRSAWDRLVPRLRRFTVSRERSRTSPSIVSGEKLEAGPGGERAVCVSSLSGRGPLCEV